MKWGNNMKLTLKIIIILGVFAIFCIGLIVFLRNKKIISLMESKLVVATNSITFIGVIFTIITLIVTAAGIIYTIKEPELDINFKTPHYITWKEENGDIPLYLVQDKQGHIDYEFTQPGKWHISLENSGDKTINKITVKIRFSDVFFIDQQYNYNMIDHLYGHGGYATLERTFNDIDPGCSIDLPYFPFEIASLDKDYKTDKYIKLNNIQMNVDIFINDKQSKSKVYKIDIKEDSFRENCFFSDYIHGVNLKLHNIEEQFAKLQGKEFIDDILGQNVYNLKIDKNEYNNYEKVYNYYINKLDCYNGKMKTLSKEKALFWGRVYYLCASSIEQKESNKKYVITDIENMIKNDIEFGRKGDYID